MAYPRRDDHARIYAEWHRAASERDGAALIALYAVTRYWRALLCLPSSRADGWCSPGQS